MTEQEMQVQGHTGSPSPSFMERAKYAGVSALGVGFATGVLGMGSFSLAFAAIAGAGGGFFAEELRDVVAKRQRGDTSRHRFADMSFWLQSGQPLPVAVETEELQPIDEGGSIIQGTEVQHEVVSERVVEEGVFPEYAENERLDLGCVLATGQTFAPHFNALFGKGIIASAVQGSGKSQLLGRLIEQAAKCGVPMVVCDHKGEYAPVTELPFVNGLRAGSAELRERVGRCRFFELSVGNADEFVAMVMEGRYQAIIDLPSYGDSWLERATIVAEVGQALMRYAAKQRKAGALLLPCLVALDEAQLYLPQNVNLLPPEAKKNTEILDSLNNAYFSLVSNGRSNGYTVVFATQSLTYIAKWAIKSCQIKIFGRHVEKNDLDMCGETISPKIATRADIETFAPGVGVVFGFTSTALVVKFDLRLSRDDSETPGLERLRMPQRSAQPAQQLPTVFEEEEESGMSMHDLCEAVMTMADMRYEASEIIQLLEIDEQEYREVVEYIRSHRSEFRTAQPPSVSPFDTRPKLQVVPKLDEAASDVGLKESSRGVAPSDGKSELSEREIEIGRLYFGSEQLNPNAIVKKLWPDIKGGDAYQKKSVEVNAAIRKYVAMQEGA